MVVRHGAAPSGCLRSGAAKRYIYPTIKQTSSVLYVKKILLFIGCLAILYYFRDVSVNVGRVVFKRITDYPPGTPVQTIQQHRVLMELALYITFMAAATVGYLVVSRYRRLPGLFLLTVLLCPLVYEVGNLLVDKSCLKPYLEWHKALWYVPMRLSVIVLSGVLIYHLRRHFTPWKGELWLIVAAAVVYQFIKKW